jgi:3-dehydroquinate synthase II
MKKEFWVSLCPWRKDVATAALESGADAVIVAEAKSMRELGRIRTIALDGDLIPGVDVHEVTLRNREDEKEAVERSRSGWVIVSTPDWTIIPLENLVAQSERIIARVHDRKEAELALTILEKGVGGILLETESPAVVRSVAGVVRGGTEQVTLAPFRITSIHSVGMGDRVCVDTCSVLADGEGILAGDTSAGFFLVHAETLVNPYVAPRPFRINAGAAHAYTILPSGKTGYLSELSSGDHVLVVNNQGRGSEAVVGRVKIERRPLLRVEAECGDLRVSLILQNAETIRLVRPDGSAVSVVELKEGDEILGHPSQSGRHFGMAVKETIVEK